SPYWCAGKVSRADLCCSAFSSQRRVRAAGSATVLAATVNATELSPMRGTQLVIVIHTTLDCAVHRYRSCKAPPHVLGWLCCTTSKLADPMNRCVRTSRTRRTRYQFFVALRPTTVASVL